MTDSDARYFENELLGLDITRTGNAEPNQLNSRHITSITDFTCDWLQFFLTWLRRLKQSRELIVARP